MAPFLIIKTRYQVLAIIKQHPLHRVLIAIDTLGKEELLVWLAQALNTTIGVPVDRMKTIKVYHCLFVIIRLA
jgi:hypothetical protein